MVNNIGPFYMKTTEKLEYILKMFMEDVPFHRIELLAVELKHLIALAKHEGHTESTNVILKLIEGIDPEKH